MRKIALLLAAPSILATFYSLGQSVSKLSHTFNLSITSVTEKTDDGIIRYGAALTGLPHTAMRIDSITVKDDYGRVKATDIDGIDFQRWFQWEDDGRIDIEIDIPRTRIAKGAVLVLYTPRGIFEQEIK